MQALRSTRPTIDPTGPPIIRQLHRGGAAAVMSNSWVDPDDNKPNAAAKPRRITGWRTYCPLRRMAEMRGSLITVSHIAAADLLREAADLARHGLSAPREFSGGDAPAPGPRSGFSIGAVAQAEASNAVTRALAPFSPGQLTMIRQIVLTNQSLHAWCAALFERNGGRRVDAKVEMGKLIAVLDILALHYDVDPKHLAPS